MLLPSSAMNSRRLISLPYECLNDIILVEVAEQAMAALGQNCADWPETSLPLHANQRTSIDRLDQSDLCQVRKSALCYSITSSAAACEFIRSPHRPAATRPPK